MEPVTVAKTAAVVVQNRDKFGKIILYAALGIAVIFLLFSGSFLYIMSAFTPEGVLQTGEYFNGADSAIYQELQKISQPFYQKIEEELEEQRKKAIEEHTYYEPYTNEKGETVMIENKPKVIRRINYVPDNVLIAYLMMADGLDTDTAVVDSQKATQFLESVIELTETETEDFTYILETKVLSETEIAELYFENPEDKSLFQTICGAYADYFEVAETKVITEEGDSFLDGIFQDVQSDVPLYLQYDIKWGNLPYGDGNIRKNGCCPTCLAMVFSSLSGRSVYPDEVAAWAGKRYYVNGAGTAWSIFQPAAANWNVKCSNIGKSRSEMQKALSAGKLIIASMGPGTFTKGGHFIVLTGITKEGKIRVNDPNDNGKKQHINKEFDANLIIREAKNMWAFER